MPAKRCIQYQRGAPMTPLTISLLILQAVYGTSTNVEHELILASGSDAVAANQWVNGLSFHHRTDNIAQIIISSHKYGSGDPVGSDETIYIAICTLDHLPRLAEQTIPHYTSRTTAAPAAYSYC